MRSCTIVFRTRRGTDQDSRNGAGEIVLARRKGGNHAWEAATFDKNRYLDGNAAPCEDTPRINKLFVSEYTVFRVYCR